MFKKYFLFALFIITPVFTVEAGIILTSYKYAWGSKVGYINFANVVVSDSTLSGYAWSENSGWIKFNPALGGVSNDGTGNLSGSAWGEGLGWINFDNVSIDADGRFTGTATGDGVGTINFDCPNYCDVRTDWNSTQSSPSASPTTVVNSSGSRSGSYIGNLLSSQNTASAINSQILSISANQGGLLNSSLRSGTVSVTIPANTVTSRTTLVVDERVLNSSNSALVINNTTLVNSSFYDIYAVNEAGNLVSYFSQPLTIVLPIALAQRGLGNLGVYWLNETNRNWVRIPDAVFASDKVTFTVNHLTRFAIFALNDNYVQDAGAGTPKPASKNVESLPLPAGVDLQGQYVPPTSINASTTGVYEIIPDAEVTKAGSSSIWYWVAGILFVALIVLLVGWGTRRK